MVNHCAIQGCVARYGNTKHQGHISTFALPRDPELREQWLQNLPSYVFKKKSVRICHFHFRDQDVIKIDRVIVDNEVREYPRKNYKLKSRAIPVFFGNCKPSPVCTSKEISKQYGTKITRFVLEDSNDEIENSANKKIVTKTTSKSHDDLNRDLNSRVHAIADRMEGIQKSTIKEPASTEYYNEEIEHLNDIAEFYQHCEDLQNNWIFLQERHKAFLCHVSLDTDVAMMDGSVCVREDLSVVLGIGHEKICHDYIPRYFKKIDTTDKLQDLMDFVMRIIYKAKKEKSHVANQHKESSSDSNISRAKELIDDSIIATPHGKNTSQNVIKTKALRSPYKIHFIDNESIEHSFPHRKKVEIEPVEENCDKEKNNVDNLKEINRELIKYEQKHYVKYNSKEIVEEASQGDEELNQESNFCQNEEVEENNEEIVYETAPDGDEYNDKDVDYYYISDHPNDNKDTLQEDEFEYETTSNNFKDIDELDENFYEPDRASDIAEADNNGYCDKEDYIEIKMETNSDGETCEEEQEVDHLMGVIQAVNKWKQESNDINYFEPHEGVKVIENAESPNESELQTESNLPNESEMQTKSNFPDESAIQTEAEFPNESEILTESLDLPNESQVKDESELQGDLDVPQETELQTELELPYQSEIQNESEIEDHVDQSLEVTESTFETINTKRRRISRSTNNTPIHCVQCNIFYGNKKSFLTHLPQCEANSLSVTIFVCDLCNTEFHSDNELSDHLLVDHSIESLYDCPHCEDKFKSREDLSEHNREHERELVLTEHKEVFKQCEFCSKEFTSRSGYLNHLKTKHDEGTKNKCTGQIKVYSCPLCDKTYRSAVELDGHINGHKGEKPYTCEVCQRSYQSKNSLYTHTKTHTGENKIYQCDHCEHTFTQKVNCIAHMRLHTGEKPFTCEDCGKSFTFIGLWKTHQRIHQGIMPYECPVCHKNFHDKSSLRKHQIRQDHPGEPIIDENHIKISMYRKKHSQSKTKRQNIES